jgi:3-methylfumaryl-CoA hydratase
MTNPAPISQTRSDRLDPARAEALCATLGRPFDPDAALPPFAHHIYFWEVRPEDALGADGHPARGAFIPETGLPRRMWAGGRLILHRALRPGVQAEKTSTVETVTRKEGRSGTLAFVTLRHDIRQAQQPAVTEWQDLVFRAHPDPDAAAPAPPRAPDDADESRVVRFTTTTLFRYSALMMNGHRIHHDIDYAREVEGYPGLVVHGPLLAQHLILMAEDAMGPLRGFRFRATAPLFHFEEALLCRKGRHLWVRGPDGRMCMEAEAD